MGFRVGLRATVLWGLHGWLSELGCLLGPKLGSDERSIIGII